MSARILIIEDDHGIQESLRELLRMEGYFVSSAVTGEAALDILSEESVDLALLDLHLAGSLSGEAVMREIRGRFSDTKVIILIIYVMK